MNVKKNYGVILLFVASIIALGIAYIAQYLFGMSPCKLCIYERIPYFITIGLFIIYLFKPSKVISLLVYLCYVCNICVSGYHVALEHSLVADIIGCTDSIKSLNFDDLKNALLNVNTVVSCDRPSIVFMGLSLAECNLIYCVLCLILCVYLFVKQYVTKR
ncbi:disulfide bond formation protein B [Ehrlichia muris]|uniref:Disulfide bond formation protein DsbB n=1 Tax=Ehrlichia muris AS145 TaxID=1423892 RepID=V9R6W6_9RICK|nr:disulfide bond formation protein B [Ehrlichia muris]AHC39053.1 disulfide bond formation protein DsbB [Ehrlichia muris AS145]